jgi:hypothetical protein
MYLLDMSALRSIKSSSVTHYVNKSFCYTSLIPGPNVQQRKKKEEIEKEKT